MATEDYTISHTGSVLGSSAVTTEQNQTAPQRETPILTFECPDNFDDVTAVFKRDPTRFVPRALETATLTDDDASGALEEGERTVTLSSDVIPVTGETDLAEQPYQAVEAVNTTQSTEIAAADLTVDYAANTVTVASSAVAAGDSVSFYPIITEGTLKFRGINALDQVVGPVYPWSFPLYRWHDMKQDKRGTEINLNGSITFERNEKLEVLVDSPHTVVWTDADYPGAYVSSFEQDVEITF